MSGPAAAAANRKPQAEARRPGGREGGRRGSEAKPWRLPRREVRGDKGQWLPPPGGRRSRCHLISAPLQAPSAQSWSSGGAEGGSRKYDARLFLSLRRKENKLFFAALIHFVGFIHARALFLSRIVRWWKVSFWPKFSTQLGRSQTSQEGEVVSGDNSL